MATCLPTTGGLTLNTPKLSSGRSSLFGYAPTLAARRKLKQFGDRNQLSIRADYRDGSRGGGGNDFVAGFLLGGAVLGSLAYLFAPQRIQKLHQAQNARTFPQNSGPLSRGRSPRIRRSLLNEDEYGFRRAKRPIYYDEGLEKTRETLNAKINQLNSAIDNVSSRLRAGNSSPTVPVETDPEMEAAT